METAAAVAQGVVLAKQVKDALGIHTCPKTHNENTIVAEPSHRVDVHHTKQKNPIARPGKYNHTYEYCVSYYEGEYRRRECFKGYDKRYDAVARGRAASQLNTFLAKLNFPPVSYT